MARKGFTLLEAGFGGLVTVSDFRSVTRLFSPGPALNVEYFPGGFMSRRGLALSFDLAGGFTEVKHGEIFLKADAAARYFLWLLNDDKIYQSQAGAPTLLFTPVAGTTHFRVVAYGNRAYIFLGNGSIGTQEPKIWDTTNLDPLTVEGQALGTMAAATSATAGQVTVGEHRIGIVYETRPGFRVPACPFGILTNTGNPADGDTVTIGWTTYRFKNTLAQNYDVKIGGSASVSFDNLKSAVNDTGVEGTDYGTGTAAHVFFRARAKTATTLTVEALIPNEDPAHLGLAEASAVLSWSSGLVLGGYYSHLAVNYITYTAPGSFAIDLTGLPLHAEASVTKRHITMTKAAETTFFIARTMEDNTTASQTFTISDAQLALQENVTDLESVMQPAKNFMNALLYHDRMVAFDGTSRVRVSEVGFPHTFRSDVGYLDVAVDDGDRAIGGWVTRDVLYIYKSQRLYWSQDNGDDPVNWPIGEVSDSLGSASVYGVDEDAAEQVIAISDFKGAYLFGGGVPVEISAAIRAKGNAANFSWADQNYGQMQKAKVTIDPLNKEVYFFIPTGADTTPKSLFVANYREGLGKVRWSKHTTAGAEWRGLLTDYKNSSEVALLVYAASSRIKKFSDTVFDDDGTAIAWNYRFGYFAPQPTDLSLFNRLYMKAVGGGTLALSILGPDAGSLATPTGITLAAAPGKDYERQINIVKERIFVELSQTSLSARFKMNFFAVQGKPFGTR